MNQKPRLIDLEVTVVPVAPRNGELIRYNGKSLRVRTHLHAGPTSQNNNSGYTGI